MMGKPMPSRYSPLAIQCDFDGTVTLGDISFLILDACANGHWRNLLERYKSGEITVGSFNKQAFIMVKEGEASLKRLVREGFKIRPGFVDFVRYCADKGHRLAIVSNGLDFYINTILETIGVSGVEVYAARTRFGHDGIEASYHGPDGRELDDNFKETYSRLFLEQGHRLVYIGNGPSDAPPASLAQAVFATDQLCIHCREKGIEHTAFEDFREVIEGLKKFS
jgi:2-hydroxy-3-keto-5-methylthiopentenyl-1-phosphate phosphatase